MKINQVKELDDGVSGITIEGKIIKTPKPPNNGEYGWSQMIILKDDTGEIGSWINIESAESAYKVGQYLKVQGKVSKYKKGDKQGVSLNGKVLEEIVKDEDVSQEKNSADEETSSTNYGTKDNYWEKKFKYEIQRDPKVQLVIVRQCAIKAATELACSGSSFVKNKKDFYNWADEIEAHIFRDIDLMADSSVAILGGEIVGTQEDGTPKVETKEARLTKASEAVGETRFKPASTLQKNKIFGYRDEKGWHKGMIESRYIEKDEIREIGDPKNLSVEKASEWLAMWWGDISDPEDIGARKQREIDNPRDENGKPVSALVKGDKTSLSKDILIDEINALRRENYLVDDEKFEKEMGYNPKLENLTEKELTKLKEILKQYNPLA